jgi:hypothetical protein
VLAQLQGHPHVTTLRAERIKAAACAAAVVIDREGGGPEELFAVAGTIVALTAVTLGWDIVQAVKTTEFAARVFFRQIIEARSKRESQG